MGRRRRSAPKRRRPPGEAGHNEYNRAKSKSRGRQRMLDQGRENLFRYDVQDLLEESPTPPEAQPSLSASIVTKAVRIGIEDARVFIREKGDEGLIDGDTRDKLLRLLERYSTVR